MQAIALENNLSETAFVVARDGGGFDLRWFTPLVEVDLCGHATQATAWVLFNRLNHAGDSVAFHTRSGPLTVSRNGDRLAMDFPAQPPAPAEIGDVADALGAEPEAVLAAPYAMAVMDSEETVRAIQPDFARIAALYIPESDHHGAGQGLRFRLAFLRAGRRNRRRSGDRLRPLHPDPLLDRPAGQDGTVRPTGFLPRRRALVRAQGRSSHNLRLRYALSGRNDHCLGAAVVSCFGLEQPAGIDAVLDPPVEQ